MALALCCFGPLITPASLADEIEGKLRVAYLFNLAKFITWPDSQEEIHLCVDADEAIAGLLNEIDGRDLGAGRRLRVTAPDSGDLSSCQILYLPDGALPPTTLNYRLTLVVGDEEQALTRGATVALAREQNRLALRMDRALVRKATYRISSKLMRLVR